MAPEIVNPVVILNQTSNTSDIDQKPNHELHYRNPTGSNNNNNVTINSIDEQSDTTCDNASATATSEIFEPKIRWPDLIVQIFLHVGAIYGFLFLFWSIKFYTFLWCKYKMNRSFCLCQSNSHNQLDARQSPKLMIIVLVFWLTWLMVQDIWSIYD